MLEEYKTRVVEGHTYKIANFIVTKNEGLYRATQHEFKMVLTPRTHVAERENFTMDFPMTFLELSDIVNLSPDSKPDYLVGEFYFSHWSCVNHSTIAIVLEFLIYLSLIWYIWITYLVCIF